MEEIFVTTAETLSGCWGEQFGGVKVVTVCVRSKRRTGVLPHDAVTARWRGTSAEVHDGSVVASLQAITATATMAAAPVVECLMHIFYDRDHGSASLGTRDKALRERKEGALPRFRAVSDADVEHYFAENVTLLDALVRARDVVERKHRGDRHLKT